jgi:glycosyltransferase involved in cell wall biosynthesis
VPGGGGLRVLVVADGLEPLLQRTVVGLADRGHRVTVIGVRAPDELDPVERFRLGRSLRTFGGQPRGSWRQRVALTRQLVRGAVVDHNGMRSSYRNVARELGRGRDFRRQMAEYLPVLGRRGEVVYFEAAYVAANYLPVLDQLGPKLVMCTGSDLRVMPQDNPRLAGALPAVFAHMGRILCRSEDLRRYALRYGAPAWRTSVLYPGIDHSAFAPADRPPRDDDTLRLVAVGRQHWVKGYEYALAAVALCRRDGHDVTLTLVGPEAGAGAELRFAVGDLDLDDAVIFTGSKTVSGVRAALTRADAFVVASVSEGVSRAAQEAMAMRLPVITTDVGGMVELVTDGREGLVVPSRDPRALAEAMKLMARDPVRRMSMGEAALLRAQDFDDARHLDRLEQMLCELAM